jgi:hypothetical protein
VGCGCRKSATVSSTGKKITGYKVDFDNGTSATYLTDLEAKRAARQAGGAKVTAVTA